MGKAIRIIFASFVVLMIAIFVARLVAGTWFAIHWAMLATGAIVGLLVFRSFLYIFTYSYGLSVLVNALLIVFWLPGPASFLAGGIAALFGLRLLGYFRRRDTSASYATRRAGQLKESRNTPLVAKVFIWFMMIWLLGFHLMPVWMVAANGTLSAGVYAGAAIMLFGVALEGLADAQKLQAKELAAQRFVSTGLFARWRRPNFFGVFLVQLGLIVLGVSAAGGFSDFLLVIVAPLYIILLMLSEARRVDREQMAVYGDDPEFTAYFARSGSMLPRL